MNKEHSVSPVSKEVNGQKIGGNYHVDGGVLTVEGYFNDKYFKKATQLGGYTSNPELLAKILLTEVLNESN